MRFLQFFISTTRTPSRRVLAGGLALVLAVLASTVALILRERDGMLQRDLQRLELLATVAELQVNQMVQGGTVVLNNLASNLEQEFLSVAQIEAMQTHYLQSLPFLRSMALLNPQGQIVATTSAVDRGGRVDLQRLAPLPLAEGRVSIAPWVQGRSLTDGARQPGEGGLLGFIPLLRPVRLASGGTLVLVALMDPNALAGLHQQVADTDRSGVHVQLLMDDGKVLAAVDAASPKGVWQEAGVQLQAFRTEHSGRLGPLDFGGEQTLVGWRRNGVYPLVSVVEQPYAVTTARWLRAQRGLLLMTVMAVVVIGLATRAAWASAEAREATQRKLDQAQAETARREKEFSILLRNMKDLIFRADANGVIQYANPRWHALTGTPAEAARGKALADVVQPESCSAVAALFQPQSTPRLRTTRAKLAGADGKIHVLEITVAPLDECDGVACGYAGSATDITALVKVQKSLRAHLAYTERILESNPLPICLVDMQDRFISVNKAWEAFMGITREQALGRTNRDLLSVAAAQAYGAHHATLFDEGTVRYEERVPRPDGSVRDVQITKVLLHSDQGKPLGILVNKLDITDYLVARDQAQQASRTKSEFVANISHELRTPLQTILGFSELGVVRARQHEKFAAMFSDIHAAGQRMLVLVNDLLDISKIESTVGAFHFERNDLRDLIEDVTGELRVLLDRKGLLLRLDLGRAPLISKVDPTRFSQVVRNVLSNAMKFTPEGSAIEVSAKALNEENIRIQIRDHGPGIPESEIESIFDAFVQSSKTRDGSGGTGLGLAICRKIVAAHGGSIYATNVPDGGSIFHITLPSASYTDTMPSPLL